MSPAAMDDARGFAGMSVMDVLHRIGHMLQVYRSRRDLAELDDRMLADVGLSRAEAEAEQYRPFWDLPPMR